MNMTIGIAEAKARLSEIVERVETGEVIVIARNGAPIAELRAVRRIPPAEIVRKIRAIGRRSAKRKASTALQAPDHSLRALAHRSHRA